MTFLCGSIFNSKSYMAEFLFLSLSFSGLSGSFMEIRRKDMRVLGHIKCACLLFSTLE